MFILSLLMISILLFMTKFVLKIPVSINKLNLYSMVIWRDFGILTSIALVYWLNNDQAYHDHYIFNQIPYYYIKVAFYASFVFMFFFILYSYFWCIFFSNFNFKMKIGSLKTYYFYLIFFLYILILLMIVMFFLNPPVLLNIFKGASALDVSTLRSEVGSNTFFKIIRTAWVPMLAYTLYYFYLQKTELRNIKLYFYLSMVMAIICALWSGAKSPISTLMLGYLGVYLASNPNNFIKTSKILILALVSFSLIILMYYLTTLNTDLTIWDNIHTAEKRLFTQSAGVAYSFFMYPNFMEFKYFDGVSSLLASLNGREFTSVYGDLIDDAAPEFSDISGALSSFAAGDAYGLFDWYGIVIGPWFAALFYSFFYCFGAKGNLQHVFIGIYAIYFGNAYLASSFYTFVWPVGILMTLFPFLCIYLISLKASNHG